MRTAIFLALFLAPLPAAHGETVFPGGVFEVGPKTDAVMIDAPEIQKELYASAERAFLEGFLKHILLAEECAVRRMSDSFDSRQIETSI